MSISIALNQLVGGHGLSKATMRDAMTQVMTGDATAAQIGALLVALRMKGESIEEITGAAEVMRELATPVIVDAPHLIDLVGTGGDGANLFNVSTAATFVAAAAGASVASGDDACRWQRVFRRPHGAWLVWTSRPNRSLNASLLWAWDFSSAGLHAKHAVGPRRELAMRTLFNVLGPLTNPAFVKRQVLGVYDPALFEPLARALAELGNVALVLHGEDGLDEISIVAPTRGFELRDTASSIE